MQKKPYFFVEKKNNAYFCAYKHQQRPKTTLLFYIKQNKRVEI